MMFLCELRARWWLAACALACAARAVSASILQCAADSNRCQSTSDFEVFLIDGHQQKISYVNGETFEASCAHVSLDENVLPFFPVPVSFPTVVLKDCAPPRAYSSYTSALRSLNVTAVETLRLLQLPSDADVSAASLQGVPPSLELATDTSLILQPVALVPLRNMHSLTLSRVHYEQLPRNLENLYVNNIDVWNLDTERMYSLFGNLELQFTGLESMTLNIPNVRSVKISSSDLYTLNILNNPVSSLGSNFLSGCRDLDTLALRSLYVSSSDVQKLPESLLKGAPSISKFFLTDSDISTLPKDLFAYTPNIKDVDLSNNRIKTLPSRLFSPLTNLVKLSLANNNMVFPDLQIIANIKTLSRLTLRGNQFESICPEGGKSKLASLNLAYLDVSQTKLQHICQDWLQDMKDLTYLNVTRNDIGTLDCSQLVISRNLRRVGRSIVLLNNNPVTEVKCSKEDYERIAGDPSPQGTELVISQMSCDCEGYWLLKSLEVRDVTVTLMDLVTCDYQECN